MRWLILPLALAAAGPALADPLAVTKTAVVVSDPLGSLVPRSLPGALVDYTIALSNPLANAGKPVRGVVFEDALPADVVLRVRDLDGAGSGPVAFANGPVLAGIGDSGLTFTFGGLASTTDSLEFFDGSSWTYVPVPDADGFDPRVRAIRVKPVTTFRTSGRFTLRFRAKIR